MTDRNILNAMRFWASNNGQKPLVLRGARQVGKTTSVHEFGKEFNQYIYLNLELKQDRIPFDEFENMDKLIERIFFLKNKFYSKKEKTLIFIDEIQEVPEAMNLLRYFYELFPEIYVIAAGSLLEFALSELPSFGVGRVRSLFMYPFSFIEFLGALNEKPLASMIQQSNSKSPIHPIFHEKLKIYFKNFLLKFMLIIIIIS
jgi:predicted AAA+ superfamily ATPase